MSRYKQDALHLINTPDAGFMHTKTAPRWLSVDFLVFYVIIAYAAVSVFTDTFRISDANEKYRHLLSPGWMFGKRQIVRQLMKSLLIHR